MVAVGFMGTVIFFICLSSGIGIFAALPFRCFWNVIFDEFGPALGNLIFCAFALAAACLAAVKIFCALPLAVGAYIGLLETVAVLLLPWEAVFFVALLFTVVSG